ncbi:MAG: CopG family antitoxin [Phycisphaerales bacterium]
MKRNSSRQRRGSRKSSLSKGGSYAEIGDFWDQHDLSDFWEKTRAVRVDVHLESEESFYAVEKGLSQTIQRAAKERGVSPHTLVNLWLQEKLREIGHQ